MDGFKQFNLAANDAEQAPGDHIRELLEEALSDPRRKQEQLNLVDSMFLETARSVKDEVGGALYELFNDRSGFDNADRPLKNIDKLTLGMASTIVGFQIPINAAVTDFTPEDITALPGYTKLHEKAREANVAVVVQGLVDESKGHAPVTVVLDLQKSYEDGKKETPEMYPELAEPPAKTAAFKRNVARTHQLG